MIEDFILINHQPTVELDFAGLHPRLLYALEKRQYNDDPYAILPDYPEMRKIFKIVFLILFNAKLKHTAEWESNQFVLNNEKYDNLMHEKGLTVKNDIIPLLQKVHAPIKKYFFQNVGLKLMNLDGQIALNILKHFANKNIPALCVHDSFVVYEHLKNELKDVMQSVYKRKTNGFYCPVSD